MSPCSSPGDSGGPRSWSSSLLPPAPWILSSSWLYLTYPPATAVSLCVTSIPPSWTTSSVFVTEPLWFWSWVSSVCLLDTLCFFAGLQHFSFCVYLLLFPPPVSPTSKDWGRMFPHSPFVSMIMSPLNTCIKISSLSA